MKTQSYLIKAFTAILFISLIDSNSAYTQNLLNLDGWSIGQGTSGVFTANGTSSENTREWGVGPMGNRVILWKAQPGGDAHADGGWDGAQFSIDHTKMYRYSV